MQNNFSNSFDTAVYFFDNFSTVRKSEFTMILIFQSWNFCNNLQYSWSSAMRDKKATECLYANLIICNSWTYGRIRWKFWPDSPSYIVMDFLDLSLDQFGASIFPPASSQAFELLKICSFNPPPPRPQLSSNPPHTGFEGQFFPKRQN